MNEPRHHKAKLLPLRTESPLSLRRSKTRETKHWHVHQGHIIFEKAIEVVLRKDHPAEELKSCVLTSNNNSNSNNMGRLTLETLSVHCGRAGGLPMLQIDELDDKSTMERSWNWGDTTYRKDGFSIGRDYLRLEGKTVVRGSLNPEHLDFLDTILGRGAFSTVYLALWKRPICEDGLVKTEVVVEKVAVKQLSLLETSKERHKMLLQELKTLCYVESPALVKLHGAFLEQGTVTTVLEFIDRGSLGDLFANPERWQGDDKAGFSEPMTAAIAFQALYGLSRLHKERILHRDIKPANLLLHSDGSLKLCDFGMSAFAMEGNSLHKTAVGTAVYMSPERLRGQPYGRSSDIWSLGLVLLQCATGKSPPWSRIASLVDLLVTVEETNMEQFLKAEYNFRNEGFKELVGGCLRHEPAQRIPANLLQCSPWFLKNNMRTLEDARDMMRKFWFPSVHSSQR
ncbi:hypothetical protein ACA910_012071 [Epithemia clementina (nom. ined.)]